MRPPALSVMSELVVSQRIRDDTNEMKFNAQARVKKI